MELNVTKTMGQLISAISFALDIDEDVKLYHAWRTAVLGTELASGILRNERKNILYASLLHDVGAIGLPNHIVHYLLKDEIPKEPAVLAHPLIGAEIVYQIPNLDAASKFILNHHEWYNGKGYPLGRQQDEIPKASQIICMADQIDTLFRNESTRSKTDIISALGLRRNQQFSSSLIDSVIDILKGRSLCDEALDDAKIGTVFQNVKEEVGDIPMPAGVDAVGIACEVFAQLIDTKHTYTIGHSKRVSRYSLLIALAMDVSHDDLTVIKWAGLLHDVGKLGIPKNLLDKPSALDADEYEVVKRHSKVTREILGGITDFKEIALVASSDHERFDGTGYPDGLKGSRIPLGARIITIADAFDAITSDRAYRKRASVESACEEIKKQTGTQFDPSIVKEALPVLQSLNLVIK